MRTDTVIQNIETAIKWANGGIECPMTRKWAEDALTVIREQEPRLIKEERLMAYDMGYLELPDKVALEPVLIAYNEPVLKRVTLIRRDSKEELDCSEMGKSWRLWTSRPTEEQRGNAAWNEG